MRRLQIDNSEEEDQNQVTNYSEEQKLEIFNNFMTQIKINNVDQINYMLKTYKSLNLVNRIDSQQDQTCIFAAVIQNEDIAINLLSILHKHGANLLHQDKMMQSIIFYIARDGKQRLYQFVKSKAKLNVNEKDCNGQNPIFYAASKNQIEMIKLLINDGYPVDIIDKICNQTALFYSAKEGNIPICNLLIEQGCPLVHQDFKKKDVRWWAKQSRKYECEQFLNASIQTYRNEQKNLKQKQLEQEKQRKENEKQEKKQLSLENKKPTKEIKKTVPPKPAIIKQEFNILHTDEWGNQKIISNQEFDQFKRKNLQVCQQIMNADKLVSQQMIQQFKQQEKWTKLANQILLKMKKQNQDQYSIFENPVDPINTVFVIRDYHEHIKIPMDYNTILRKLSGNFYENCNQYVDDVKQIYYNCILYNGPDNAISVAAREQYQMFFNICKETNLERFLINIQ